MPQSRNEAFADMASSHINLANSHAKAHTYELTGIALTHAAARYNSFILSQEPETKDKLAASRDEFIDKLVEQYREFVTHHYDGYVNEQSEKA